MKQKEISLNTKKQLAQALKNAMKKKPFSKITVSELIADCNINRNTFYYHFDDIYALLRWMFEEEVIEVVRHFDLMADYEEAITFVLDYVEQNEHILNCAVDAISHEEIKRFFYADFISIISPIIENAQAEYGIILDAEYRDFLVQFYTNAITGMAISWIRNPEYMKREYVVRYITVTIHESLKGVCQSGFPGKMSGNASRDSLGANCNDPS